VLFYNRQTRVEGDGVSSEEATASSSGSAVAIKMVGRISYVKDNVLVDEFADWNQSYPTSGSSSGSGIRFYRMADLGSVAQGIDGCSSIVYTSVKSVALDNEYMIASGRQVREFCSEFGKSGSNLRWGHQIKSANGVKWSNGDPYGMEIGSIDLPKGYVYGSKAAKSAKMESAGALTFRPTDADANTYKLALDQTITISAIRGGTPVNAGSITAKDIDDNAK